MPVKTLLKRARARVYEDGPVHRAIVGLQAGLRRPQAPDTLAREASAYWSESRAVGQRQALSHWRGVGRWSEDRWLSLGREHRSMLERFCASRGRSIQGATLLEWGPGGGSNVLALLQEAKRIYGVDISQSNLDECQRQVAAETPERFTPILFEATRPESVSDSISEPVDIFYSTAVFQHFPTKAYGERVLQLLSKLMPRGGCAMVQIRYDDGRVKYLPKLHSYRKHAVTFTSYAIPEFWSLIEQSGFTPAYLTLLPANNYAYYFFTRT